MDGWKTNKRNSVSGKIGAWWKVGPQTETEICIAISYVSMDNALQNLHHEIGDKKFTELVSDATSAWDQQLGKIKVIDKVQDDGHADKKITFYTALYHSLLHPNIFSDVNGDYLSYPDGTVKNDKTYPHYSVFSMWYTYRNIHSLLSLLYPKQQQEMIYSLEDMTLSAGHPLQWELLASEVNMMVGGPALSVIAEAYKKGFNFKQIDSLFSTLYKSATENKDDGRRPGNASYLKLGYIPEGISGVWDSVSTTLEYSYHDWSLAQLAKSLSKQKEYQRLLQQSSGWKQLFDTETNLFRPRLKMDSGLKILIRWQPVVNAGFPVPAAQVLLRTTHCNMPICFHTKYQNLSKNMEVLMILIAGYSIYLKQSNLYYGTSQICSTPIYFLMPIILTRLKK